MSVWEGRPRAKLDWSRPQRGRLHAILSRMSFSSDGAPMSFSRAQLLYLWLATLSCACLMIGDVVGIKLFTIPLPFRIPVFWSAEPIAAITHTCGMLVFPVTFLITDLVNEYFGKRAARRVVILGVATNILAFAVMNVAQYMPRLDAPYNISQEHFDASFGSAKGLYVASTVAYLAGQFSDIAIFGFLKRLTGGRAIWLRATGSTLISQLIDSFLVSWIAFGLWRQWFPNPSALPASFSNVIQIALTGYVLKFVIAIAITPLIYAGHGVIERLTGLRPLVPETRD